MTDLDFIEIETLELARLKKVEAAARKYMQYHNMYGNGIEIMDLGEALGLDEDHDAYMTCHVMRARSNV